MTSPIGSHVTADSQAAVTPERTWARAATATGSRGNSVDLIDREALFAQFSPLVRRLVRQYGGTLDMRQDLLGELYCLFHSIIDRYDPARGVPLHPYVVRQLSVSAFTFVRKQWRQREHERPLFEATVGDLQHTFLDPTPEWDTMLEQRQLAGMLPSLLPCLPTRQRQVLVLRYYEERSFEEIARLLDIQQSSARSLLRHALNRLREHIASDPVTD